MAETPQWALQGVGYEFCNCDFGCGCNFAGFPNSDDGSCRALVGMNISRGQCGDVDLAGVRCAAVLEWPKAIHDGNGKCVFIVGPETTDGQIEALSQICTGQLGGLPWEILGPTFEVIGLEKASIVIEGEGVDSVFRVEGIAEGKGEVFKNPVTGEPHHVNVDIPGGFIWSKGQCGVGSFKADAGGLSLEFSDKNWIYYDFDWSNTADRAA